MVERRGFIRSIVGAIGTLLFGGHAAVAVMERSGQVPVASEPPAGLEAIKIVCHVEFDEATATLIIHERWIWLPKDCIGPEA